MLSNLFKDMNCVGAGTIFFVLRAPLAAHKKQRKGIPCLCHKLLQKNQLEKRNEKNVQCPNLLGKPEFGSLYIGSLYPFHSGKIGVVLGSRSIAQALWVKPVQGAELI